MGRYGSPLFQSTLLTHDADLEVVPDLATDWGVSADGLVGTVDLRGDAVFSYGTALTADDVAYTFTTAADSGGLTDVTALDEAVAVDSDTVELRLVRPQSTFVDRLISLGIVPSDGHGADYARNPVGSGPFRIMQWDQGQQLIVERNEDYYGQRPGLGGSSSSSPVRTPRRRRPTQARWTWWRCPRSWPPGPAGDGDDRVTPAGAGRRTHHRTAGGDRRAHGRRADADADADADAAAIVLVTHELHAALGVANRVVICRDGRTVDVADPGAFTGDGAGLAHPYTRALRRALPANGSTVPAGI